MCCCGKAVVNGEMGYKWQPDNAPSIRPVDPPAIADGYQILFDEPGRCGGLDCHSHHFRLVKSPYFYRLLVRHGGGDESMEMSPVFRLTLPTIESASSDARYWLLHSLYSAYRDGKRTADEPKSLLRKAMELMPLGTKKRAEWFTRASKVVS